MKQKYSKYLEQGMVFGRWTVLLLNEESTIKEGGWHVG